MAEIEKNAKGQDRAVITLGYTGDADQPRLQDAIRLLQARYPGARIILREIKPNEPVTGKPGREQEPT